jgi:hypothetical protein
MEDIEYRDGSLTLRGLLACDETIEGKTVKLDGVAYNARTDKRSWAAMQAFFDEIFA